MRFLLAGLTLLFASGPGAAPAEDAAGLEPCHLRGIPIRAR
ncbi:MAG: hypothetical protein R3200_10380 [Xanthomonadales bacterium]|nr:hypothetical protein [Xanthomonadales bacterium]